ncbi:MAG: AAA family ATPase [Candidatus Omnitrophica bacterium]|nr:AAA family ATPase [Candidatus Omnitrophota bacterium]
MKTLIEVRLKRGLSLILGNVGTGKTTLCRKMVQMFKERTDIKVNMILDPLYKDESSFIDDLLRIFGIKKRFYMSIQDKKDHIKNFLLDQTINQKKTIVLIIDEAQKMTVESLEVLRMLLNFETNDEKLLQLILVGQLELKKQLKKMPNLVDRIGFKCLLEPLADKEELKNMIDYRISVVGEKKVDDLFSSDAIEAIFKESHGFPRKIGMLCHKALRELVMRDDLELISGNLIREMAEEEKVL